VSDTSAGNGVVSSRDEHEEIHLPPNSWIPLSITLSLAASFIGLLPPLAPWLGIIGLVWFLGTCYAWFRSARTEYLDLPESGGH
jgi:hypothetical protein